MDIPRIDRIKWFSFVAYLASVAPLAPSLAWLHASPVHSVASGLPEGEILSCDLYHLSACTDITTQDKFISNIFVMQLFAAILCSLAVVNSFLLAEGIRSATAFQVELLIVVAAFCSYSAWSELPAAASSGASVGAGGLMSFASTLSCVVSLVAWLDGAAEHDVVERAQDYVMLALGICSMLATYLSLGQLGQPASDFALPAVGMGVATFALSAAALGLQVVVMRGAVDRMCGLVAEWIVALVAFACSASELGLAVAAAGGEFDAASFDALQATSSLLLLWLYGMRVWLRGSYVAAQALASVRESNAVPLIRPESTAAVAATAASKV